MNDNISLINLSYEKALLKHEKMVEKFIWLLRNSESLDDDFPINDISWFYSYFFRREEIIYNKELYDRVLKMDLEERLEEELKHMDVSLCMVTPTFSILNRLPEVPQEVRDLFRKTVEQRMYIEKFFEISKMKENGVNPKESFFKELKEQGMNLSYPMTMDIWDEATADLTIDDLKIKLQEAIDVENYEEAAKIQKQIDNKK